MLLNLFLLLVASTSALLPARGPVGSGCHACNLRSASARCSASDEPEDKLAANVLGGLFGLAIAQQIGLGVAVAAGRLGLWNAPPVNLFTDIADNAMEAGVAAGDVNLYFGTAYATGIWKELLDAYYATGETTEFLTKAGGVCAEHAAWCAGIAIP